MFLHLRERVKPIVVCGSRLCTNAALPIRTFTVLIRFNRLGFDTGERFHPIPERIQPGAAQRHGNIAKQQHSSIFCKNDQ